MSSRINRITKTIKQRVVYRDFKMNFDLNPITSQLELVTNEQAVIQSIRNLVLIYPTEIYYHPNVGSTVTRELFNFVDEFTMERVKSSITQTIQNNEPRAQNLVVRVTGFPTQNYMNVDIAFQLANVPNQSFSVPTIPIRIR